MPPRISFRALVGLSISRCHHGNICSPELADGNFASAFKPFSSKLRMIRREPMFACRERPPETSAGAHQATIQCCSFRSCSHTCASTSSPSSTAINGGSLGCEDAPLLEDSAPDWMYSAAAYSVEVRYKRGVAWSTQAGRLLNLFWLSFLSLSLSLPLSSKLSVPLCPNLFLPGSLYCANLDS